jgi:hypothetical protein
MSEPRALYPYYEEGEHPTFPGEMPTPQPVGFNDPGISSLKANADHSHAPATDSGTVVQERMAKVTLASWGGGALSSTWIMLGAVPLILFNKRFGGTNLRFAMGASCWSTNVGGNLSVGVSPTNSSGDIVYVTTFFFNNTGIHEAFTGMAEIANRGAADYNCSWWVQSTVGPLAMNSDANDTFWVTVAEVWP